MEAFAWILIEVSHVYVSLDSLDHDAWRILMIVSKIMYVKMVQLVLMLWMDSHVPVLQATQEKGWWRINYSSAAKMWIVIYSWQACYRSVSNLFSIAFSVYLYTV